MGDATTPLTPASARHLLRRTGFGALPLELSKIIGLPRGVAVDDLLNFIPSHFRLQGDDVPALHNAWTKYLARPRGLRHATGPSPRLRRSSHALQEKLVLFWHDHFATNLAYVPGIIQQNRLFRRYCKGNFKDFVKAINKNPLMMGFLDTIRNVKTQPNENYARELMELFTLGVTDFAGAPNYLQADIVQIARAFTGWIIKLDLLIPFFVGGSQCAEGLHDYMACYPGRGPKVIFQSTGGFGPQGRSFTVNGEGAVEIDTVIDIIFDHRDSQGHNTVARHLTRKLFSYFAHPNPETSVIDELVHTSSFDSTFDVASLLRAMFVHDDFYASAAPAAAGAPKSVKWPIDYVISTLRLLRIHPHSKFQNLTSDGQSLRTHLIPMGQAILQPPSVFGWDWEEAWLTSGRLLARFAFANSVLTGRKGDASSLDPTRLLDLELTDPGDIVDAVTDLLGVAGDITDSERQVLIAYLGGPLDLHDASVRAEKLNGLIGIVLVSPAYQLH